MMGLADTMMSRDQTWLFFTLGRCLERTDVVARQLATVAFDEVFDSGLVMLLRSCGGYEPYLRLSQGVVEPGRVLDFLLRDRLFPRSAFASLTLAEECLDQINAGREGAWDDARGLVGLARAELEYSAPATLARGLETRLERLQASISSVSDAVTRRYFAQDLPDRSGGRGWRRVSRADGWRLRVSHETRFDYDAPARASYNELRLTPRTELRQTALETRVVTVPAAPQYSYVDYWGTHVVAFNVDRGHEVLSITGNSLVDTQHADEPDDCTWERRGRRVADHGRPPRRTTSTPPRIRSLPRSPCGLRAGRPLETARRIIGTDARLAALRARCHLGAHLRRRGLRRRRRRVPGLRPPGPGPHQVGRAARRATSRATSIRRPMPPSARRSRGRAMPGSRCGRDAGGATTRRTTARWGSATSPSAAVATTATCRR